MNPITGKTEIQIGDKVRTIACDMNAAAILFSKHGEHWNLWLLERFAGKPTELPDGSKGRLLEPLGPAELMGVLYALLASDRARGGIVEDEATLGENYGLQQQRLTDLQMIMSRCILVSYGIPGEAFEAAGGAVQPRGSERAVTVGTGSRL